MMRSIKLTDNAIPVRILLMWFIYFQMNWSGANYHNLHPYMLEIFKASCNYRKKEPEKFSGRGMAVAGLATGYVAIGITALSLVIAGSALAILA